MVRLSLAFVGLVAASAHAAPVLYKRIAQVITESTANWEKACDAAGGGAQCNQLSVAAFGTLLANAGPCDQQNAADALMTLSKKLNSDSMISLSTIFAQQPRNSPNSVAIPYCQQAPQNKELNGLFQCQFAGSNQNVFVGNVALGGPGTIPFGLTAPVSPLGSCNAHKQGPVPDGQQLVNLVGTQTPPADSSTVVAAPASTSVKASPATTVVAPPAATTAAGGAGGFKLANGQAAQKLNAKFATLTADSACTAGENACIGTAFAQCVNGKFVTQSCGAAPLTCAALPLVNSAGTSITCTTLADAEARIAATGATGGVTGSGSGSSTGTAPPSQDNTDTNTSTPSKPDTTTTPPTGGSGSGSSFALQNGKDAQALNTKFAQLSTSSTCIAGESACVDGGFAQCVSGKFVVTQCGATLTCAALPLVNSRGTSVTCTTAADALARIQATGATGGITGA